MSSIPPSVFGSQLWFYGLSETHGKTLKQNGLWSFPRYLCGWVSEVLFLHGKTWWKAGWNCLRSPMPPAAIHPYPMKARVWIKHSRPSADADVEICKEKSCSLKHFKTKGSHLSMDHRLSVTWSFTAGFSHQEWGWWPKLMFTPYVYIICVYIYVYVLYVNMRCLTTEYVCILHLQ